MDILTTYNYLGVLIEWYGTFPLANICSAA